MKRFNYKILFPILCMFLIICLSACMKEKQSEDLLKVIEKRGNIIAGIKYDSKPFGFMDTDQVIKGFDVDLIKEITRRILGDENAVEFRQVTSSNRIFALTSGTVDLVAATMTINDKRQEIIDFSRPYYIAGQAIMVNKNSPVKYLKDLAGKKVIVVLGSTSEINIRQMVPDVKILGFRTYTDAFNALKSGRGDALTTDDSIIYGFLSENPEFKILNNRLTQEPYGLGFKKSPETIKFQNKVDGILRQMAIDGTLRKIEKKWTVDFSKEKKATHNILNGINFNA